MNGMMSVTNTFTIFGGTGDLAYRKLMPAFYNMSCLYQLKADFKIIVVGRKPYTRQKYLDLLKDKVIQFSRFGYTDERFQAFCDHVDYFIMNITEIEDYHKLNDYYKDHGLKHHIFYMAVAPKFFIPIADGLSHIHHTTDNKVMIEKPFGENLRTAMHLNKQLEERFKKDNIYHIDHYLGKEMIQNIYTIRFQNIVFANVWNKENIEYVEISAFEELGVENRGAYYDDSGALKDMVQNHLFQILTIIATEIPEIYGEKLHKQQLSVLNDLRPINRMELDETLILGQYKGYVDEKDIKKNSRTETYAALKVFIDNERWRDVPFYLRTGKKMHKRDMEVVIQFKSKSNDVDGNRLIIKIQPQEGVYFEFNIKTPGASYGITRVKMDFCQSCMDLHPMNTPEAYERLLQAAMDSDKSLFSQWEQIAAGWKYIHQLKELYKQSNGLLYEYEQGSKGPSIAQGLF